MNYFSIVVAFEVWYVTRFSTIMAFGNCYSIIVVLDELYLNGLGAWRTVSQRLWSSNNGFSMVMVLDELFLNGCCVWQTVSQRPLCSTNHFVMVMELDELFLNWCYVWWIISQWLCCLWEFITFRLLHK